MRPTVLVREAVLVRVVTGLVTAAVLSGCAAPPEVPPATPSGAPVPSAAAPVTAPLPESPPLAVSVPVIGVAATGLVDLGLTPSGAMEVPDDAPTVGWFGLGPTPGETGPAVLAAHVDYAGVDGAFVRLADVRPGDAVDVQRADGTTTTFTAYRVERFAKSAFPTDDVYGDTAGPELRLITCGGAFDDASGSYADNVVVFAHLTGVRTA